MGSRQLEKGLHGSLQEKRILFLQPKEGIVRRPMFLIVLLILVGTLSYGGTWAIAGDLIIHSGATLSLNNARVDLNCSDLIVQGGGTIDLGSSTVEHCGNFILHSGSTVIWGTGTIGLCVDSDGDGLFDYIEDIYGTDPNNPDSDGDGLLDGEEDANQNGTQDPDETDATNPDTDGDGFGDGAEVEAGTDPLDPQSHPSTAMPWVPLLLLDD